jgi:hypothetical protein
MIVNNKNNETLTNTQQRFMQAAQITKEQLDSYSYMIRRANSSLNGFIPDITDFAVTVNNYSISTKDLLSKN